MAGYYSPEFFCDRETETSAILGALHNGRNVTLISPRRMGKTGLIRHAFYRLKEQEPDIVTLYMDIYSTQSMGDFVRLFANTVLGKLDTAPQKALSRIGQFIRSCRPVFTFDELTGIPKVTIDVAPQEEESTLKEIFDYLGSSEKRCYIAIDEFQQIAEYPEKGIEALLRSYIQFLPNVYFIFAGSSQHLMSEMFLSAKRPFYQSSQIMSLPLIEICEYETFANKWLKQEGIEISDGDFRYLYDMVDGQTWYVQCILNRLYENGEVIDKRAIVQAVENIINEQEDAFINYCKSLTDNQVALLTAIAKEKGVSSVLSQEFIRKYSLPAASSVSIALKALQKRDFVHDFNGKIIVYDRFFSIWLRKETEPFR